MNSSFLTDLCLSRSIFSRHQLGTPIKISLLRCFQFNTRTNLKSQFCVMIYSCSNHEAEKNVAKYGSWVSPISADIVAGAAKRLGGFGVGGDGRLLWIETRPREKGLKIFAPVTILALVVLIPVNVYDGSLSILHKQIVFSDIDKLSISNVSAGSQRFWFHILMTYVFTIWTCFILYKEYSDVALTRLHFLASQGRHVDQFTVVVRNIPHVSGHSISESVDQFFQRNHPEHYLGHQAVYNANKFAKLVRKMDYLQNWLNFYRLKLERHPDKRPMIKSRCLGFFGAKVDAVEYYTERIKELDKELIEEREIILNDPKAIMPVAFVMFNSRWAAAVCTNSTKQKSNPLVDLLGPRTT